MTKTRVRRFYYRGGRIHAEKRQVKGHLHGPNRVWHQNGQLAEELHYHHGLLHGISRQWDEHGRLLGSFTMMHGTGTQRYWHDNGQLRLEFNSINGKFFGPTRMWLRDGTLVQETFYISNVDVSRSTYLRTAREHPEWPQCADQPARKVARNTVALKRKEHKLFIQALLEKSHAEAKQWLTKAKSCDLRALGKIRSTSTALRFVEELYAAGAATVVVAPVYAGARRKLFADSLLVEMPRPFSKRKVLRKLCRHFCDRHSGALLPDEDIGESHLFLGLA